MGRVNTLLHVPAGFFDDLAHLPGLAFGQLLPVLSHEVCETTHDFAAQGHRDLAPLSRGLFGAFDGSIRVFGAG
jgi:hypothetical protein